MDIFPMMSSWFFLVFAVIMGIVLWRLGTSLLEALRNNVAPQEWYTAELIGKRTHVGGSEHSYTNYYLAFELENGERKEFRVKSSAYALSAEGDKGELSFKGSRFLDFKRK